jgi:hypothetical protein
LTSQKSGNLTATVQGGEAWVVINTGYNQAWGFHVTATGTVEIEVVQMPWIVDVLRSTALAAGRIAASLTSSSFVKDPKAADPEKLSLAWLDCELLEEGLPVTLMEALRSPELTPLMDVVQLVDPSLMATLAANTGGG